MTPKGHAQGGTERKAHSVQAHEAPVDRQANDDSRPSAVTTSENSYSSPGASEYGAMACLGVAGSTSTESVCVWMHGPPARTEHMRDAINIVRSSVKGKLTAVRREWES